jgi:hypothetical protein
VANDAATLNGYLDLALRDSTDVTWTSAEKDASIARAVRNLSPKVTRSLDPASYTLTLVAGTYYYSLNAAVVYLSRLDLVEADGTERGPLRDGTWETSGDLLTGAGKVHVSPTVVDKWDGSTLRCVGYGRYDVTTNYIPDDYIELVISIAAAELIKRLLADRSAFLQHGVTRQDQNISVTEMVTMLNAFEQAAREKKAAATTFRKPVPGRV